MQSKCIYMYKSSEVYIHSHGKKKKWTYMYMYVTCRIHLCNTAFLQGKFSYTNSIISEQKLKTDWVYTCIYIIYIGGHSKSQVSYSKRINIK